MYFFTKIVKTEISHTTGILVASVVMFLLYQMDSNSITTLNKDLDFKVTHILHNTDIKTSFLHVNGNIINHLYTIREYQTYNSQVWNQIINNINNLFNLYRDTEIDVASPYPKLDLVQTFNNCRNFYINTINSLHSMIFTIPLDDYSRQKFKLVHSYIRKILKTHLEYIRKKAIDRYHQNGIDSNTNFENIASDRYPKGVDLYTNSNNVATHYNLYV
jgi:hypothetical protein